MKYNFAPDAGNCNHTYPCIPQYTCFQPSPTIINISIPPCPESKQPEPFDFSKVRVTANIDGEIIDPRTGESSGVTLNKCKEAIDETKNIFTANPDGKIVGECNDNELCKICIDLINVIMTGSDNEGTSELDKGTSESGEETPVPEDLFAFF